jgi:tRNA(fMet)-specific endonuclease VapC
MAYLVDTNAWIMYLRGMPEFRLDRLTRSLDEVVLSSVVAHELLVGAGKALGSKRALAVEKLKLDVRIVDFDLQAAEVAAKIRLDLEARGMKIGPMDTLIAGQRLAHDLTLVTRNVVEFSRVPGLRIEDWQAD